MPSGRSVVAGRITKHAKKGEANVHPKSRKANKIGKALAHEKRVDQRSHNKQVKDTSLRNKLEWFQCEISSNDFGLAEKRAFTHADIKLIVNRYVGDLKEGVEEVIAENNSLPSKRVPNKSQLKREADIQHSVEKEISELETLGLEIPDLLAAENVRRLRDWDGSFTQLPAIRLMRFKGSVNSENDEILPE